MEKLEELRKKLCLYYTLVLGIMVIAYVIIIYTFGKAEFDQYDNIKWVGDIPYIS